MGRKVAVGLCALAGFLLPGVGSAADFIVAFSEDAPRDRLSIVNRTLCGNRVTKVTMRLAGSNGALIFDTTPGGAGIDVAQPIEVVYGAEHVSGQSQVVDGGETLVLAFRGLDRGQSVMLTIDLDDRLPISAWGQTRIVGEEIAGATVQIDSVLPSGQERTDTAVFGNDSRALLTFGDCAMS